MLSRCSASERPSDSRRRPLERRASDGRHMRATSDARLHSSSNSVQALGQGNSGSRYCEVSRERMLVTRSIAAHKGLHLSLNRTVNKV